MLTAIAFLCGINTADCERDALARAVVGRGATPTACLMDGQMGAAANIALEPDSGHRLVIVCRRNEPDLADR